MRYIITQEDIHILPKILQKHSITEIFYSASSNVRFSYAIPFLAECARYSNITIENVPYCILPAFEESVVNAKHPLKQKLDVCVQCKHDGYCGGVFRSYLQQFGNVEFIPIKDIPEELIIEVTRKCDLNCIYCFNRCSFAKINRVGKDLETEKIKMIIDQASGLNIPFLRFTGGEPLLREDLPEILSYARKYNFTEIRLNTNGQHINEKTAVMLAKNVDNILLPFNAWDETQEEKITGKKSLSNKILAVSFLKKAGIKTLRGGTIAFSENIEKFSMMEKLIIGLALDNWEWYRPISVNGNEFVDKESLRKLVDILFEKNKQGKRYPIANAVPFCFYDPTKTSTVAIGGKYDDGHRRMVVSPEGYVKPSYFLDINMGSSDDLLRCWQKIKENESIPQCCQECKFVKHCKGGSRQFSIDPLIIKENITRLNQENKL